MALNALTISTNSGVQGRPFQAVISGLSAGSFLTIGSDGSPGFSTVNGNVISQGLPYPVSTLVLREALPGVGIRESRIEITSATADGLRLQALASVDNGRTLARYRVAGVRQSNGSYAYSIFVEDDLGATKAVAIGNVTPPGPGAQITSATTQTQPGASQRYYQATADRPGTWAISTGATMDSATGIWTLNANNTGDGSTQSIRTPTITFTPTDGTGAVAQLTSITLQAVDAPASVSESYTTDFTGAAGTQLHTLPGWALFGPSPSPAEPILNGAGKLDGVDVYDPNGGVTAVMYSPAGGLGGSEIRYKVRQPSLDNRALYMFVGATDNSNGFINAMSLGSAQVGSGGGAAFKQGGTFGSFSSVISPGFGNYKVDATIEIIYKFSADGNTLNITIPGNGTTQTGTVDFTGKTKGSKFGFLATGPFSTALGTGLLVESISFTKAAITLSVTDAPLYSTTNAATYALAWAGTKPTRLRHRFRDENQTLVTPWMIGESVVTGTTSGTISYVATAPGVGTYTAEFSPLNDIGIVVAASQATAFVYPAVEPTAGINLRAGNYFYGFPMGSNIGQYHEVGGDKLLLPYEGWSGDCTVTVDAGTAYTEVSGSSITILSRTGTTMRIRRNVGGSYPLGAILQWSGTSPTTFDVVRDGVSGPINPEWIAGVKNTFGSKTFALRNLDMTLANIVPENYDLIPNTRTSKKFTNDIGVGPNEPYEAVALGVAALGTQLGWFWDVHPCNLTAAEKTARATFQRDTLLTSTKIIIQHANEDPWNSAFAGVRRGLIDGVRKGYYGSATWNAPNPQLAITYEGSGPATSLVTTNAHVTGDRIVVDVYGVGNSVWRCTASCPAGTRISADNGGTSANWTQVGEEDKDLFTASLRYSIIDFNETIEIYRSVFGAARFASQIYPCIMRQGGGGLYAQLATERDYMPGYFAKIRGVGYAGYFSHGASLNRTTCTVAQLEASYRAEFQTTVDSITSAVVDAIRMGKIPMCYELGIHPYSDYGGKLPDNVTPNNYTQVTDTWQASDTGRQIVYDYMRVFMTKFPGVFCQYDGYGAKPWSLAKDWLDTTNPKLVGFKQAIGA